MSEAVRILDGRPRGESLDEGLQRELAEIASFYGRFNGSEVRGSNKQNNLRGMIEDMPLDLSLFQDVSGEDSFPVISSRGCGYGTCYTCTPRLFEEAGMG